MLSFFLSYLLVYRYTVLFLIIALASLGVPIPATALLIAAGAFAAQGYFDFSSILMYWFFASILGDTVWYLISRRYGRGMLVRIGFKGLLTSPKFVAIESIFNRHSILVIFSTRFLVTSLGPAVNILSGLSKITYRKFFLYDFLGELLYVILFGGLGYIFGNQWETISQISEDVTTVLVLIVILLVLFAVVWQVKNGKK